MLELFLTLVALLVTVIVALLVIPWIGYWRSLDPLRLIDRYWKWCQDYQDRQRSWRG